MTLTPINGHAQVYGKNVHLGRKFESGSQPVNLKSRRGWSMVVLVCMTRSSLLQILSPGQSMERGPASLPSLWVQNRNVKYFENSYCEFGAV